MEEVPIQLATPAFPEGSTWSGCWLENIPPHYVVLGLLVECLALLASSPPAVS